MYKKTAKPVTILKLSKVPCDMCTGANIITQGRETFSGSKSAEMNMQW
jgi:tRNA(Arg) A34 adenosine deaminase TadA